MRSSGWTYNSSLSGGMDIKTPNYSTRSGTYYGRGQVRMYNGNGYNTYTTTQSPYVQGHSMQNLEDLYKVNENNEVYGSELILDQFNIKPDLIEAMGNNNVLGYVKAIDLEIDIPDTLEEVIIYQNNLPDERKIPLYENDGETVIGTYTVYYNLTEEIMY